MSRLRQSSSRNKGERDIDRGAVIYDRLVATYGCDPFAIMARIAMGDVVGLDLMTEAELAKPAKQLTFGTKTINTPSGRQIAIELIPPGTRFLAAKELAQYCKPKLASTQFLDKDGKAMTPQVVFYAPDNGRDSRDEG